MGYELHIVRRKDWDDLEEDSTISLEEWLVYVQQDKELELTNGYQIKIPGVIDSFQDSPGFCKWTGHSTQTGDDKPWFDYAHGQISAKYPDDETIKKMIMIADKLNAKVQGDDGEFYDDEYFKNKEEEQRKDTSDKKIKKSRWKLW